ncbi:MAG: hypothetical protein AB8G26_15075 [Ilumatobacter sp.]
MTIIDALTSPPSPPRRRQAGPERSSGADFADVFAKQRGRDEITEQNGPVLDRAADRRDHAEASGGGAETSLDGAEASGGGAQTDGTDDAPTADTEPRTSSQTDSIDDASVSADPNDAAKTDATADGLDVAPEALLHAASDVVAAGTSGGIDVEASVVTASGPDIDASPATGATATGATAPAASLVTASPTTDEPALSPDGTAATGHVPAETAAPEALASDSSIAVASTANAESAVDAADTTPTGTATVSTSPVASQTAADQTSAVASPEQSDTAAASGVQPSQRPMSPESAAISTPAATTTAPATALTATDQTAVDEAATGIPQSEANATRQRPVASSPAASAVAAEAAPSEATALTGVLGDALVAETAPNKPGATSSGIPVVAPPAGETSSTNGIEPTTERPAASAAASSDPTRTTGSGARLAEHVAMRDLVERIDRHRLASSGRLELEIVSERFGAIRVEALDSGDGVQLSLRGDGAAGHDLSDLAEELRQEFDRDGDRPTNVRIDGDGEPRNDAARREWDRSTSPERFATAGTGGLDLRL